MPVATALRGRVPTPRLFPRLWFCGYATAQALPVTHIVGYNLTMAETPPHILQSILK